MSLKPFIAGNWKIPKTRLAILRLFSIKANFSQLNANKEDSQIFKDQKEPSNLDSLNYCMT